MQYNFTCGGWVIARKFLMIYVELIFCKLRITWGWNGLTIHQMFGCIRNGMEFHFYLIHNKKGIQIVKTKIPLIKKKNTKNWFITFKNLWHMLYTLYSRAQINSNIIIFQKIGCFHWVDVISFLNLFLWDSTGWNFMWINRSEDTYTLGQGNSGGLSQQDRKTACE